MSSPTPPTPDLDLLAQDCAHDVSMLVTGFLNGLPDHLKRQVARAVDGGAELETRLRAGVPMRLAIWLIGIDGQAVELGRLDSGDLQ